MKSELRKLLDYAESTIGTKESPKGTNNVIFNTRFYGAPAMGSIYPWTCVYIWDLFNSTGISKYFCDGEKVSFVKRVQEWAINNNRFISNNPSIGDLILLNTSDEYASPESKADRIALLVDIKDSQYISIEGDCKYFSECGKVSYMVHYPTHIVGFVKLSDLYSGNEIDDELEDY